MKDGGMYLLCAGGGAKLEMWRDPPPPGTESISLPGGAAKGAGLGGGVSTAGRRQRPRASARGGFPCRQGQTHRRKNEM